MRLRFLILFFCSAILAAICLFPTPTALGFGDIYPQTGITPISPVVVSTPNPDGSIIHIVRYGQTLVMISEAYGIPISQIRTLNGMPEGIDDIYEGQRLIIRVALPPTETPTLTPTTQPPTRTPRNTTPIMTPTPLPKPNCHTHFTHPTGNIHQSQDGWGCICQYRIDRSDRDRSPPNIIQKTQSN